MDRTGEVIPCLNKHRLTCSHNKLPNADWSTMDRIPADMSLFSFPPNLLDLPLNGSEPRWQRFLQVLGAHACRGCELPHHLQNERRSPEVVVLSQSQVLQLSCDLQCLSEEYPGFVPGPAGHEESHSIKCAQEHTVEVPRCEPIGVIGELWRFLQQATAASNVMFDEADCSSHSFPNLHSGAIRLEEGRLFRLRQKCMGVQVAAGCSGRLPPCSHTWRALLEHPHRTTVTWLSVSSEAARKIIRHWCSPPGT